MLRHVAVFSWAPETSPADVEAFSSALAGLPAVIPEIREYRFGPDAGLGQSANGDFAVVADFDSDEDYRTYASHPAHQEVIVRLLRPILGARLSVQIRWDSAAVESEPSAGSR